MCLLSLANNISIRSPAIRGSILLAVQDLKEDIQDYSLRQYLFTCQTTKVATVAVQV